MRKEQFQSLTTNQETYNNHTLSGRNGESMRAQSPVGHQTNFFGTDLLLQLIEEFYNHKCRHSTLGNVSPSQFENKVA